MTPQRARFEDLYEKHYPAVLAYCLRRTSYADAHDAAAETFTVTWRRIADVPAGEAALPWMYGVAYRVLSHQWRSAARWSRLKQRMAGQPAEPQPGPERQVVRHSQDQEVIDAVGRLKPQDQEVIRLITWEQLPREQVAELLGCTRAAVDQRMHRALKRLERSLARPPARKHHASPFERDDR